MISKEQGYTLVEVVVAFCILGLIGSFTIPIFFELKERELSRSFNLEAISILQEKIEVLSSELYPYQGQERVKEYNLRWKNVLIKENLIQIEVEVEWQYRNHPRKKLKMVTYRYKFS